MKNRLLLLIAIICAAIIQNGCKKSESGPPVINSVRLIDSPSAIVLLNKHNQAQK